MRSGAGGETYTRDVSMCHFFSTTNQALRIARDALQSMTWYARNWIADRGRRT